MITSAAVLPLPSSAVFHEPLLRTLGQRTNFDPMNSVFIPSIFDTVVTLAGFDPLHLPGGWALAWLPKDLGIYNPVQYRIKSLREKGLIKTCKRGFWSLTPAGIEVARSLCPPLAKAQETRRNATGRWLNEHLTPERGQEHSLLFSGMMAAVKRHLPGTARAELVEDSVNNYIVRAIQRDAFAAKLQMGKLAYSQVISYCVNSGRTDARNLGTDPVSRELLGARTEQERKTGRFMLDPEVAIPLDTDGNPVLGTVDDFTAELDFERTWERVVDILHDLMPQAGDRYLKLLAMRAHGCSLVEIAEQEGVSRNRAASMLAEARRCLRGEAEELAEFLG